MYDPNRAFLILSPPRSGSTLLRLFLHHCPGIRCHGELLGGELRGFATDGLPELERMTKEQLAEHLSDLRVHEPIRLMQEYALACDGVEAVGFKVHYYSLLDSGFPALVRWFAEERSIRIVHLWRENELARYASQVALRTTKRPDVGARVRIDPDDFAHDLQLTYDQRDLVEEMFRGHPWLETTYENIVEDPKRELQRLTSFLGVRPQLATHVKLPLYKVNASDLGEMIENYDEIREHPLIAPYLEDAGRERDEAGPEQHSF